MKYALGSAQMKAVDRYTIETIGIPSCVLMEKAAMAVVRHTKELCSKTDQILAVCGYGNNGGDGIAAARILYMEGYPVAIAMIGDAARMTEETKRQLQIAENLGIPCVSNLNLEEYTVIIDGIFGIGLTRPAEGEFYRAIEKINHAEKIVVAIDIPSGVCADNGRILGIAVKATVTVTFGYQKIGCLLYPGAECAGRVFVEDIGFAEGVWDEPPKQFYFTEPPEALLPMRSDNSHKGTYGKVLVVAGSKYMSGAAYFSAMAAYRMGAGLVRVLTAEENREILLRQLPEAVLTTYRETEQGLCAEDRQRVEEAVAWAGVIVIGPGLGTSGTAAWLTDYVLEHCRVPLVMDADAINRLADRITMRAGADAVLEERMRILSELIPKKTVLTPHKKELAGLTGISMGNLVECLIDSSRLCTYNNELVFVKKDVRTLVSYQESDYINVTGNHGMATAGSGDVLAGMIAGILAQGAEPEHAARVGVYLHGLAGNVAAMRLGARAMLAGDILDAIPAVLCNKWEEQERSERF